MRQLLLQQVCLLLSEAFARQAQEGTYVTNYELDNLFMLHGLLVVGALTTVHLQHFKKLFPFLRFGRRRRQKPA